MAEIDRLNRVQNDAEQATVSYQRRMGRLAQAMQNVVNQMVSDMVKEVVAYLIATRYYPPLRAVYLQLPASSPPIQKLMEYAMNLPVHFKDRGLNEVEQMAYDKALNHRIVVRELMKLNAQQKVEAMRKGTIPILMDVAEEGMTRGTFMVQKELGIGWQMDTVDMGRVEAAVNRYMGDDEAWKLMEPYEKKAELAFIKGIAMGKSVDDIARDMNAVTDDAIWKSKRDARTKITEVSNDAHMQAYIRAGVKNYVFIATFDERTCPVCGKLDHQAFPIEDAQAGINYPPMHPNCRCTTVAKFSDEIEALRPQTAEFFDRSTGETVTIPRNMSYTYWYTHFGPGRTDGVEYKPKFRNRE